MRCKGKFKNDRVCDLCKLLNKDMYYDCKAIAEDKKNRKEEKKECT